MKSYKLLIILFLLVGLAVSATAQNYKVVVNSSNNVSSLSQKQVSDFFLKKTSQWPNGTTIMPVDLNSNVSTRVAFSKGIHGKSVAQIRAYWQQAVFAGKGTPPTELQTDAKVIDYVRRNSGAIGYVSRNANTSGVKVLNIN